MKGVVPILGLVFASVLTALTREPDPIALLKSVEQARNAIRSGRARVEIVSKRPEHKPRKHILELTFDGQRHSCETQDLVEYSIQISAWPSGLRFYQRKAKELNEDREKLVQLGLLESFRPWPLLIDTGTEHYVLTFGSSGRADVNIYDSGTSGSYHNFDPRTIGLTYSPSPGASVADCLGYANAKEVNLRGQETVANRKTWRVEVVRLFGEHRSAQEFWIDDEHRHRVLRFRSDARTVDSIYDPEDAKDPLPRHVREVNPSRGNEENYTIRWRDRNFPIHPNLWTLAGMGLPQGATISDIRSKRRLGYWDGQKVSERFVSSGRSQRRSVEPMLRLIRQDPAGELAFHASIWMLFNNLRPSSAQNQAIEALTKHHLANPDLVDLIPELARSKHPKIPEFLTTVLRNSPDAKVQAWTRYVLALIRKRESVGEAVSLLRAAREQAQNLEQLRRKIDEELKSLGHQP